MPRANIHEVLRFQFPLPGLVEQKRIVALLDAAFEGIVAVSANTEKNITNARELFESQLNRIFSTSQSDWIQGRIGEFAQIFDGPHATPKIVESGPIFLGISSLQDGYLELSKTRHVTSEDFKKWTRRVRPLTGDVVFSYETRLGQAAIIPDGITCCLGRRMGLIRLDKGIVLPEFFLYQYLSPPYKKFLETMTLRGATVNRLPLKEFPNFPFAYPARKIQERIVGALDSFRCRTQRIEENNIKKLRYFTELKQSLLQKAFSGQLTARDVDRTQRAANC